jgi:hypothetical protein
MAVSSLKTLLTFRLSAVDPARPARPVALGSRPRRSPGRPLRPEQPDHRQRDVRPDPGPCRTRGLCPRPATDPRQVGHHAAEPEQSHVPGDHAGNTPVRDLQPAPPDRLLRRPILADTSLALPYAVILPTGVPGGPTGIARLP